MNSAVAIAALALSGAAHAQSFTTVFGPNGGVGDAVPDSAVLNGLESFTTFGGANNNIGPQAGSPNTGEVLFFQIGPFYVGGAGPATSNPLSAQGLSNLGAPVSNNNAYGVLGTGRSDIIFDQGAVESVTLQVRGTADGLTTGSSPNNSFGGVQDLADASGTVLIWTELGLQATVNNVSLDDFQTLEFDISALAGDSITRISLINDGPFNSGIVLGELTVGVVPSPGAAAVIGLGAFVAGRRRRGH